MKYLGCAYYPEYWGVGRVQTDAKLMRAAGINLVRIGEFAWSRMETAEGHFELDWLHATIEILGKHGIDVLLCTPTATPPAWLTAAYPDVLLVRGDGTRMAHGSRRHYCTSSDTYRRHSRRITEMLSRDFARHANVVAWQLDNEFGPEAGWCHCPNCQAQFRAWLRTRYGSVQELNQSWKTGFWSIDFTDWSEVCLEDGRIEMCSAQKLDSRRFWSERMVDFALEQADIIRRNHPRAQVTTNGMGPIFSPIDYYRLFETLDVACDDLYFDIATMENSALAMNLYRQIKPDTRYWLTETGSGALDHNKPPHPDQFRAWAWSSFAHGADAHVVFRWRTCLSGQEQELQGILEHSGKPRHRYAAVKRCFLELASFRDRYRELPLPKAAVAIIQDYQTLWGYESSRIGKDIDYPGTIYRLHKEFYRRNILVDILPPGRTLSRYKLVVLPSLMIMAAEFAQALAEFVKAGGVVLAVGQLGLRDANDAYLAAPGPQHLEELFGLRIEGGMFLRDHCAADAALWVPQHACKDIEVALRGALGGKTVSGKAKGWIGDLTLKDAEALVTFAEDTYAGQPAVTEKQTGKGRAIYATPIRLSDEVQAQLIEHALSAARIAYGPAAPLHVEVVQRGHVTFVVNHTNEAASVTLKIRGKASVGDYADGVAALPAYGVCVIERATDLD